MLDHLAREDHLEVAPDIDLLRVAGHNVESLCPRARRELVVELDPGRGGGDTGDQRVHPIGTVDTGSGADVQHRPALEIPADPREAFPVRTAAPLPRLQRMSPSHAAQAYVSAAKEHAPTRTGTGRRTFTPTGRCWWQASTLANPIAPVETATALSTPGERRRRPVARGRRGTPHPYRSPASERSWHRAGRW